MVGKRWAESDLVSSIKQSLYPMYVDKMVKSENLLNYTKEYSQMKIQEGIEVMLIFHSCLNFWPMAFIRKTKICS